MGKTLLNLFKKKPHGTMPLLIIRKEADEGYEKGYASVEDALADLEKDPNVPLDKLEKLKSSLKQLKNITTITIRNGEILF